MTQILVSPVQPPLALAALELARSQLGQAETAPNEGPIVSWSMAPWTHREPGPWAAWCAAFVSTCFLLAEKAQRPAAPARWHGVGSTSCTTLLERCIAHGFPVLQVFGLAMPGDLVFFRARDGSLEHVGLVQALNESTLVTIEGNARDQVRRRTYHSSFDKLHALARCPW